MRNFLALILGLISFLCAFVSLNHIVIIVDSCFNIWGIIMFSAYIFANYITFIAPVYATVIFQNSRWPILVLYAFIVLWEVVFIFSNFFNNGFTLLPLIVYGYVAVMAVLSFIKCFSSGSSYALDLDNLTLRSREENWSVNDYLSAKEELDITHRHETIIALIIYGITIAVSFVVFCAEWFFLYK